jgi:hypothetical protein
MKPTTITTKKSLNINTNTNTDMAINILTNIENASIAVPLPGMDT